MNEHLNPLMQAALLPFMPKPFSRASRTALVLVTKSDEPANDAEQREPSEAFREIHEAGLIDVHAITRAPVKP